MIKGVISASVRDSPRLANAPETHIYRHISKQRVSFERLELEGKKMLEKKSQDHDFCRVFLRAKRVGEAREISNIGKN